MKTSLTVLAVLFLVWHDAYAANFCVRADGTATKANSVHAESPVNCSAANTAMSIATFNAVADFVGGSDTIYISGQGGNYTTSFLPTSSGTAGNLIYATYDTVSGTAYKPTFSGSSEITLTNVNYWDLTGFQGTGTSTNKFNATGTSTGNVTHNFSLTTSGSHCYQHIDTSSTTHYNAYCGGSSDQFVSLHCNAHVYMYTAKAENLTADGIRWAATSCTGGVVFYGEDIYIDDSSAGSTGKGALVSGNINGDQFTCKRCYFKENPTNALTDPGYFSGSSTSVDLENVIITPLTSSSRYFRFDSSATVKFLNVTMIGDGTHNTTCVYNNTSNGTYKNNYFSKCGTQAFGNTTGTLDYNGYYNSGTVRGTHTTTGDPLFSATGRISSASSPARGAGIGPGADATIPTNDIDSDARSGSTTDLGADQYTQTLIRFLSREYSGFPLGRMTK